MKNVFWFLHFFLLFFLIFTDFLSQFGLPPPPIITTASSADVNASAAEYTTVAVTVCIPTIVDIFRLLITMTAAIAAATRTIVIYSTTDTVVIVAPSTSIILVALALLLWKGAPGTALRWGRHRPRSSRSSMRVDLLSTALTGTERVELNKI